MLYDKKWETKTQEVFSSAKSLKIPAKDRAALIEVLRRLEAGELQHTDPWCSTIPNGFNTQTTGKKQDCGTVACIGGWVAFLTNRDSDAYVKRAKDNLCRLYWPDVESMAAISVAQAARALRSYLTTGQPNWKAAMADGR